MAFDACHYMINGSSFARVDWPDGGCYLNQPAFMVKLFNVIKDEILTNIARSRRNDKGKSYVR